MGGGNSATDGDLDIAYALLLAEKRWARGGAFDYGAKARKVLAAILAREAEGDVLLIGDRAQTGEDGLTKTRV